MRGNIFDPNYNSPFSGSYNPSLGTPKTTGLNAKSRVGLSLNDQFFSQNPGLQASDNSSRIRAQYELQQSPEYQGFLNEGQERYADGVKQRQEALYKLRDQPSSNPLNSLPRFQRSKEYFASPQYQQWAQQHVIPRNQAWLDKNRPGATADYYRQHGTITRPFS